MIFVVIESYLPIRSSATAIELIYVYISWLLSVLLVLWFLKPELRCLIAAESG